ncbi:MAG: hypothetical protein LBR10_06755 [Prevotellaceae bacterium]|jgi:tetratricopeptide (TPR) repeat protein|nr:hypothetical protein [Prevotellaceae bacterium]
MKKLLIAVFLLTGVCTNVTFSQKFEKKIAASDKSIADPKKGANPKTWISRGELFYEIANAPTSDLVVGMDEATYNTVMATSGIDEKVTATTEKIGEETFTVHNFSDKKIYFTKGIIMFWDIFKYEVTDPFQKSYESYAKAKSLDTENKNSKKLSVNMKQLATFAKSEAFNKYHLNKYAEAVTLFKLALDCFSDPLVNEVDSLLYYFTGVIAGEIEDYATAEKYLRKAIEIGYTENGDAYASLGKALTAAGKSDEGRAVLEKGITVNPENQQLIFNLINNYMATGKDPKDIIPLIDKAIEKEPNNASLYSVEGQLYDKIGDAENAAKYFKKAIEIDSTYFFGYYGLGILYFNTGAKYSEQATNEKDNTEYERLLKLSDEQLKLALPYLEKSFQLNSSEKSILQALKDINFRFRNENDTYKQNAEKYTKLLEE